MPRIPPQFPLLSAMSRSDAHGASYGFVYKIQKVKLFLMLFVNIAGWFLVFTKMIISYRMDMAQTSNVRGQVIISLKIFSKNFSRIHFHLPIVEFYIDFPSDVLWSLKVMIQVSVSDSIGVDQICWYTMRYNVCMHRLASAPWHSLIRLRHQHRSLNVAKAVATHYDCTKVYPRIS